MYRIEVAPGEETVFRTIEELAVGIRNGVVTPRARIYHNASQKWLPIGLHPHYKKAMELPAASAAHPTTPRPTPPRAPAIAPRLEFRTTGEHRVPWTKPNAPRAGAANAEAPSADAANGGAANAAAPKAGAQPIPAPVISPIVAMQQEVLRDLPVVAMPEPLPWTAARAPAPLPAPSVHAAVPRVAQPARETSGAAGAIPAPAAGPAHPVQAQPTATVTYAPLAFAEPAAESTREVPVEAAPARPTARRSQRGGGRPLLLIGVAAAVVLTAHFALTARSSASADASDAAPPADAAPEPPAPEPLDEEPVEPAGTPAVMGSSTEPPARVSSASARVEMIPGPAFAGSAPVVPGGNPAMAKADAPAAGPTPSPTGDPAPPVIAPAPAELELGMPALPADSIAPAARTGDTLAMKKILRALNGTGP